MLPFICQKVSRYFVNMTEEKLNSNKLNEYVCINCGNIANELYKKYSSSVLKLVTCTKCEECVDKYIEFEPIIILIDLVLLSRPAYRHILFNTKFQIHWKLTVCLLLLESYILWINKTQISNYCDKFTSEKQFYLCFLLTFLDNLLLFIFLRVFTIVLPLFTNYNTLQISESKKTERSFLLHLTKSITLANTSKFFLIPIMIWKNNVTEFEVNFNLSLVFGYFILALIHVYSVATNCHRIQIIPLVLFAILFKSIFYEMINDKIEKEFMLYSIDDL